MTNSNLVPINQGSMSYKYLLTVEELAILCGIKEKKLLKALPEDALVRMPGNKRCVFPSFVKEYLSDLGVIYDFKTIAHINLRGGIGKTTSSITLATRAAQYGYTTCLLDMDPQGSASLAFDRVADEDKDLIFYDVWQKPSESVPEALKTVQEGLTILPSALENSLLDTTLLNPPLQKKAVTSVCDVLKEAGTDLVVIDCPPSLGAATISAICAADIIVIPVSSDAFSFKGLELTLQETKAICETFGLSFPEIRILFSMYDKRKSSSASAIEKLEQEYSDYVIPVYVKTSTEYSKALENRETIFASSRKSTAHEDYDLVTQHILNIKPNQS